MDFRAGPPRGEQPRKFLAGVREQLIAYTRHQSRLTRVKKDGHTERQHLEAAAKIGGPHGKLAEAELAGPEFPEACAYVWTWFCELLAERTFGPHGPNPITSQQIKAWAELTRRAPRSWEVDLLRALDIAWLSGKDADGDRRHGAP